MSAILAPTNAKSRLLVPALPAFDPEHALSLETACRLGLVPGRNGRRLTSDELLAWATDGYAPVEGGPRFVFPTILQGNTRVTTADWCAAWVTFLAEARESLAFGDGEVPTAPDLYNTGDAA
jgi:hypothetical protein